MRDLAVGVAFANRGGICKNRLPGTVAGQAEAIKEDYLLLWSRSQLGSERIFAPETSPMATKMVTMEEPP